MVACDRKRFKIITYSIFIFLGQGPQPSGGTVEKENKVGLELFPGLHRGVKGSEGESRGVQGSQGESRGVKDSQEESWGVKGSQEESREVKGSQGESRGVKDKKIQSIQGLLRVGGRVELHF